MNSEPGAVVGQPVGMSDSHRGPEFDVECPHVPDVYRAKYVVVTVGAEIESGLPVPSGVPPHALSNHSIEEPAPPIAVSTIDPILPGQ